MGDVGVDPQRLNATAAALAQLRDVLAATVPVIVNTLSSYGSPVNTGVLKQAQARSVQDAQAMRERAQLAQLWERQQASLTGHGMATIPWDLPAVTTAERDTRQLLSASRKGPSAVNAWWMSLSAGAQQLLIQEFPSRVGWLDGVPAAARDQANRLALSQDTQALRARLAALRAEEPAATLTAGRSSVPSPAWQRWESEMSAVQGKLAGTGALERALGLGGSNGYPHAYLLGFDTNGNGHAIVSFGNPDTAASTVTYVPGVGSKLAGAAGDSGRAAALWQQASKIAPGTSIASIYWLGYNAPQLGLSQGLSNLDMSFTSDQPGIPDHSVVLGHSYGSLVAGEAVAHDHMHPGDLIVVGSPGVGVDRAGQLGLSPQHVWAGANTHDPVPALPPWDPIPALSSGEASHFGANPGTPAFGGHIFNADSGTAHSYSGLSFGAHSAYWDPNSDSLKNMAFIVDRQYSNVILEHPAPSGPGPVPGAGVL